MGCLAVVVTGMARKGTRVGWRTILEGLRTGAVLALPISLACATAGIVVGVIGQTGIGLQFTESVVQAPAGCSGSRSSSSRSRRSSSAWDCP